MYAKIIADSVSPEGKRIVTVECEYPRFIHSELMTHRVFSRNAASSRAIPISAVIEQVRTNPAMPVEWGKNQAGMQAKEVFEGVDAAGCLLSWRAAACAAADEAEKLQALGLHKQIVNRVLEPFVRMKTVITSTEWDNFFWLRRHEDAQPEIKTLADMIYDAMEESGRIQLEPGEWHTPYYGQGFWTSNHEQPLEVALKISASCCAQVSYRKLDDSLEKAEMIYDRLVESSPIHASPFEHQASPMPSEDFVEGATHMCKDEKVWSGNFQGWVQYRQLIKDNVCTNYEGE